MFSLTFYGVNGHEWVEELLVGLPGGEVGFLIVVNILVFVLAFFLDFFELAFIIVPLLGPAAEKLGIDLIWFGVILGVNMQTSFMHPPFGFALFYLRSVAPKDAYLDKVTGKRDGAGHHRPDLLGRGAVRVHPGHHGRPGDRVPADGHALQGRRNGVDPELDQEFRHSGESRCRRHPASAASAPLPAATWRRQPDWHRRRIWRRLQTWHRRRDWRHPRTWRRHPDWRHRRA